MFYIKKTDYLYNTSKLYNSVFLSVRMTTKNVFYMKTLQIGECTELYVIFKNGDICVTKRAKIGLSKSGYVLPRFLREISVLRNLNNPPEHLKNHPGRDHVIKLLDVYINNDDGNIEYFHFDMEYADGTLIELISESKYYYSKNHILTDISKGLEYIHLMGYNHCDISFNNIVYFVQPDKTLRFVIIDFGNSVHKDKPFTIDMSTEYTMANELIEINANIKDIGMKIKYSKLSTDQINTIYQISSEIRDFKYHTKFDIWSLGAMAHIMYANKLYENNWDDIDQLVNDENNQNIEKIKKMLVSDSSLRPCIYFLSQNKEEKDYQSDDQSDVHSNHHELYCNIITDLIENMSMDNDKNFFINIVDKKTQKQIINEVFAREPVVLEKILVINFTSTFISTNVSTLSLVYMTRLIVLWLCSHMFINDVWNMCDILTSLSKRICIPLDETNRLNLLSMVNKIVNEIVFTLF